MKHRTFLLILALAVFVGGPTALAAPSVDTLLTAGYDAEEMKLIYSVSPVYDADSPNEANNTNSYDCRLVGEYEYELDGADDDEARRVSSLTATDEDAETNLANADPDDDGDVFFFGEDTELDPGDDDYLAPLGYGAVGTEECDLTAYDVRTTAEGEVNHGMVVSTFVQTLKASGMKGIGCLVRHVAQSDWGKEEAGEASADLTVTLAAFEASCNKGKHAAADSESEDGPGGKPAWAGNGKPPWAGPDGDKNAKPGKGPKGDDSDD